MTSPTAIQQSDSSAIRPFPKVNVPEAELTELRRRITATRWPDREYVADQTQGVQLATMQKLARYWATDHDWRKVEAKLNALPQFITEIDGLDIHFIHVKSKEKDALPLIITHGWPGSVLKLITRVFDGQPEGMTRDDVLDNITFYWLTNTAISSARLYWENNLTAKAGFFDVKNVTIPVAVSVFPDEIYAAPKSWAEKAYPKLIFYNKHDKGAHFAAWEQPEYLTSDLREAFRTLRA